MCEWLGIDTELVKEGRSSFTFEELPPQRCGLTFIVEPEVAARGVAKGRLDLVVLPEPCAELDSDEIEQLNLRNIADVPVVYGTDDEFEAYINPEPEIRPYCVRADFDECDVSDDVRVYGLVRDFPQSPQALIGLPPRKEGTLYLARPAIAALAHIGGRFDIVGIKGTTPYV